MKAFLSPILLLLLLFSALTSRSQNQALADSLVSVLETLQKTDTSRLQVLTGISANQNDPRERLRYSELLLDEALAVKNKHFLHHAYLHQGQAFRLMGDFEVAIYALLKSLNLAEEVNFRPGISASFTALADAYSAIGNPSNAIANYRRALDNLGASDQSLRANILLNMGDEFYLSQQYDSALHYFTNSRQLYLEVGENRAGLAYNQGNIGLVQAELNQLEEAEVNIRGAIEELEAMGDTYGIAVFLSYMADIYQAKGRYKMAQSLADSSMSLSLKYRYKTEVLENSRRLAEIHASQADYVHAYGYHRQYVALRDSIATDEIYARMANLENAFTLAKKQAEVDLLLAEKRNQQIILGAAIIVMVIVSVLALVIFNYYRQKTRINILLEEQKQSLEALNGTKDKLLSIISHDLRGPISAFHGIPKIIEYSVITKNEQELLDLAGHIDQSVNTMSSLLDNLLNWALQQQGQFPSAPERILIREAIGYTIDTFANMARGKDISVISKVESDLAIWADKNMTLTILRNLVNNALKFTKEGGTVVLSAQERGDFAELCVEDNGVGIPKEELVRLFDLEEKKRSYGTAGERGLGLGLHLVSEFAELCGGSVLAESQVGKGTVFRVKLPKYQKGPTLVTS